MVTKTTEVFTLLRNKYCLSDNDIQAWTLMKADLLHLITRDRFDRVGVYGLLNRLMVLFQLPVMISILEETESGRIDCRFTTFADPVNFSKGQDHLDKLSNGYKLRESVRVFETNFYILVRWVVREEQGSNISLKFVDYQQNHGCLQILKALFDLEVMAVDGLFQHVGGQKYWEDLLKKSLPDVCNRPCPELTLNNEPNVSFIDKDVVLEDLFQSVQYSYNEIKKSRLINIDHDKPANLFYFIRTYDSTSWRYGVYDYRIRMVIPEEQERELVALFREIRRTISESNTWSYRGRKLNHFHDKRYVKEFIDILSEKDGVDQIIDILKSPSGQHLRSFLDPVFSSGISDMRRDPLHRKLGLDRIDEEYEYTDHCYDDRVRISALFYLFSVIVPDRARATGKYSCFIKPLRVGASPWLCFVTFAEFEDQQSENYLNWQLYRHFYYDICVPQGRRIRGSVRRAFLASIERTISEFLLSRNGRPYDISEFESYLKSSFKELSRFFPYPMIAPQLARDRKTTLFSKIAWRNDSIYICFDLGRNMFYPEVKGKAFDEKEHLIVNAISDGFDSFLNKR